MLRLQRLLLLLLLLLLSPFVTPPLRLHLLQHGSRYDPWKTLASVRQMRSGQREGKGSAWQGRVDSRCRQRPFPPTHISQPLHDTHAYLSCSARVSSSGGRHLLASLMHARTCCLRLSGAIRRRLSFPSPLTSPHVTHLLAGKQKVSSAWHARGRKSGRVRSRVTGATQAVAAQQRRSAHARFLPFATARRVCRPCRCIDSDPRAQLAAHALRNESFGFSGKAVWVSPSRRASSSQLTR